jgi:hypothetical protein
MSWTRRYDPMAALPIVNKYIIRARPLLYLCNNGGRENVVRPSACMLTTVINADSKATITTCHGPLALLTLACMSRYHIRSPLSFLAARNPGRPSSELLLFFAWYSWSVPAEICLPAQWPSVSRSWKHGSCFDGSLGSGRRASIGTAKPHDVWTCRMLVCGHGDDRGA